MTNVQTPPDRSTPTVGAIKRQPPDNRSDEEKFAERRAQLFDLIKSLAADDRQFIADSFDEAGIPKMFGPEHENWARRLVLEMAAERAEDDLIDVRSNRPTAHRTEWICRSAHTISGIAKKLGLRRNVTGTVHEVVPTEAEIALKLNGLVEWLDAHLDHDTISTARLMVRRDGARLAVFVLVNSWFPLDAGPATDEDSDALEQLRAKRQTEAA
jgi:hypothetical protein